MTTHVMLKPIHDKLERWEKELLLQGLLSLLQNYMNKNPNPQTLKIILNHAQQALRSAKNIQGDRDKNIAFTHVQNPGVEVSKEDNMKDLITALEGVVESLNQHFFSRVSINPHAVTNNFAGLPNGPYVKEGVESNTFFSVSPTKV